MATDNDSETVQGTLADEFDIFYVDWAKETVKRTIPFLNETLRQLVMLNAALFGGAATLLDKGKIGAGFQTALLICFLLSLFFAACGMLPYQGQARMTVPDEVRRHKAQALRSKSLFLNLSGVMLMVGLVVALVAVVRGT